MRTDRVALAIAGALLLASCGGAGDGNSSGGFEQSFRDGWRKSFVEKCGQGARSTATAAVAAQFDFDKLCACSADKLMKDASMSDLMNVQESKMKVASDQCFADLYPEAKVARTS